MGITSAHQQTTMPLWLYVERSYNQGYRMPAAPGGAYAFTYERTAPEISEEDLEATLSDDEGNAVWQGPFLELVVDSQDGLDATHP